MRRPARHALLALAALSALFVADAMRADVGAQDYYRRYDYDAPPPERPRRYRQDPAYGDREIAYERRRAAPSPDYRESRRIPPLAERQRSSGFGGFLQRLFGGGARDDDSSADGWGARRDPGAVEIRPAPRPTRRRAAPDQARTPPPLPPNVIALPAEPAITAPTTVVAVFGDAIAEGLADGLASAFSDAPDVAVRSFVKPNGGLVRADYFDFVDAAKKALAAGPVAYAVVDVGVNDRQPFQDGSTAQPLSEAWRKRYVERVDALLAVFTEHKVPVYWVGLAPSDSDDANADHTALNVLTRDRVEAAGGVYVDVWEGFVDEDGAFEAEGPQLDGQIGRLRLDDGVRFTAEGSRKLAHYVEREIRKVYKPAAPQADAIAGAVSPEGDPQDATAPAAERPRRLASPLVVLTAPRRAENGALAAAALAVPARDASPEAERVLVKGEAQDGAPGRLDDYKWPGAEKPAAQGAAAPEDPAKP
ncbi:DUF459 domain-containing protein [Hansschlegelia quercus]|uniref:DUF459 domain-containing protein n=1 Tax=Hansschlegelia quercus TaxID=2528245 RepID=A0A4Q9GLH0_9HYPH|nr:DUF459 domain-containing protein [Hansschlegelia quercus]TBN55118.1 DUF459 domain-containing protein [Hansschlegelia quercus]